ncbi:MAG: hypothetical protein AAFW73_10090 [Bacteroidota bacterium]
MKKVSRILSLFLFFALVVGISSADAQSYGKKKRKRPEKEKVEEETKEDRTRSRRESTDDYFDESGGFTHRLWYGGGLNLGFSGINGVSSFQFGISPMVGYKITDNFSVGPRVGINYNYFKFIEAGRTYVVEPVSYTLGGFSRYKFIPSIFAHVEYEWSNEESIDPDQDGFITIDQDDEILTGRLRQNNFYVGLGYNSGGTFAYEIMLLYNLLEPEESLNTPFNIRAGFTYKF